MSLTLSLSRNTMFPAILLFSAHAAWLGRPRFFDVFAMRLTFPSWLRWYKKPEYRDIKEYATNVSSGKRPLSPDGRNGSIPSRLRLDRILANKTCQCASLATSLAWPRLTRTADRQPHVTA